MYEKSDVFYVANNKVGRNIVEALVLFGVFGSRRSCRVRHGRAERGVVTGTLL